MDIKDDAYASYKLLRGEFKKKQYKVSEETVNDRQYVTFTSPSGRQWRTSVSNIAYPFNTPKIRHIAINKDVSYDFAKELNVSIPFTYTVLIDTVITDEQATDLLKQYPKLIVKPAHASLSRGLTLNIQSVKALQAAILVARELSPSVLIQEQVEGEEVRFVAIDGKIVSALLRRTPRVVGNGVSTVAELIDQENIERKGLIFEYISYPQLTDSIISPALLVSKKVLEPGRLLELNRATMIKNGCSVYDVLPLVDVGYVKTIEKLITNLGAHFMVTDVFFKDFTAPQQDDNYWFIEFNTSPVLKLFYGCRDGRVFDIVPRLVGSIDTWLHATVGLTEPS